jgi:hypothetical protein
LFFHGCTSLTIPASLTAFASGFSGAGWVMLEITGGVRSALATGFSTQIAAAVIFWFRHFPSPSVTISHACCQPFSSGNRSNRFNKI